MSAPALIEKGKKEVNRKDPAFLVVAIGNSGRADDGLGWAFGEAIEDQKLPNVTVVFRYQLQVEDAELISRYPDVLFVDAAVDQIAGGVGLEKVEARGVFEYTTHALEPASVLGLCQAIYNKAPRTRLLKIQGTEWGLRTGMSRVATHNLGTAVDAFKSISQAIS